MWKINSKVTLCLIILMTIFLQIMYLFDGRKHFSEAENRKMSIFPRFSIEDFLNGDFQENMESALKDQIFQREPMISSVSAVKGLSKKYVNVLINQFEVWQAPGGNVSTARGQSKTFNNNQTSDSAYAATVPVETPDSGAVEIAPELTAAPVAVQRNWLDPIGNVYRINGTDYLTLYPLLERSNFKTSIRIKANQIREMIARHPKIKTYVYYITKPEDLDWFNESEGIRAFDYAAYVRDNLPEEICFGQLEYSELEELMEWSNMTDHHWNHKGAHKGYTDIYNMVSRDFQLSPIKEPISELDFDNLQWIGSNGKSGGVKVKPDVFRIYEYELGIYKAFLGKYEQEVGLLKQYKRGEIDRNINISQYEVFYGGSEASSIIKYVFPDNKHNLLLITDSNNRPIRRVLASHFNTSIVLDYRVLKKVSIDDIIKDNDIHCVVFAAQNRYWCDENIHRINNGVKYVFPGYPVISD